MVKFNPNRGVAGRGPSGAVECPVRGVHTDVVPPGTAERRPQPKTSESMRTAKSVAGPTRERMVGTDIVR